MEASLAVSLQNDGLRLPAVGTALNRLLTPKPIFSLHDVDSPQRAELEAYITRQFGCAYGATITEYLPQLFSMRCQGRVSAVAGIRVAAKGELFVERYLDDPVEQVLNRFSQTFVVRQNVVEIGNLVATHRGVSQLFLILHATVLYEAGIKWAVFSATDGVAAIIDKLNFVTVNLGLADPECLGEDADQWGRYYDTRPTVLAADIVATVAGFRQSPLPAAVIRIFGGTITELAQSVSCEVR